MKTDKSLDLLGQLQIQENGSCSSYLKAGKYKYPRRDDIWVQVQKKEKTDV